MNDLYQRGIEEGIQRAELTNGHAVRLLTEQLAERERFITALQAHNTELLFRARKAEDKLKSFGDLGFPKHVAADLTG